MTWNEHAAARTRYGRTYENLTEPGHQHWSGTLAALHYAAQPEGGLDRVVDMRPERVANAALDGWQIRGNPWHFVLGKPGDKTTDGWVGFGAQQGAYPFRFRLTRLGYLHWPTRSWQDIGGAPTYDRARLSAEERVVNLGPTHDPITVEYSARWAGLWTTPGAGEVTLTWRASGDRLKEAVVMNAAARTWLQANRAPTTPLGETYFGFVFQLDWTGIPKVLRNNQLQDIAHDFDDSAGRVELRDSAGALLGIMPLDEVYVLNAAGEPIRTALRKRFWSVDGSHFMLIGLPVEVLAGLPEGDLVFDPTISITDNWNDGFETNNASFDRWWCNFGKNSAGEDRDAAFRFQAVNVPQGATITAATLTLTAAETNSDSVYATIKGIAEDNPSDWSASRPSQRSKTTATVDWNLPASISLNSEYDSPEISSIIQEIVDRSGWQANNALALVVENKNSATGENYSFYDYDEGVTRVARLEITYTTPSGGGTAEAPLELLGETDDVQLTVRGHTTQTEPLQAWQDSGSADLAQITGDGRFRVGDLSMSTPAALMEANEAVTLPTSAPQRGLQSLGQITGAITEAVAWAVHELQLLGSQGVSGLHTALRARLVQANTGDASQAELRGGDFEATNQAGSSGLPVGQITGVHGHAANAAGAYAASAVGVEAAISNDTGGSLTEACAFAVAPPVNTGTLGTLYGLRIPDLTVGTDNYAIHTGAGRVRFGGVVQGFRMDFVQLSTNTTLTDTEQMVAVDAGSGPVTVTLPSAANLAGRLYIVKKVDASANAVTVAAAGAETVDGAASQALNSQWASLRLVSNGSAWMIV